MSTLSQSMLAAIQRAAAQLEPEVRNVLGRFLYNQWMPDGGGRGRGQTSDLYYTVFLLASYQGLGWITPQVNVADYLNRFGAGQELDFVHRFCLARCRGLCPETRMDVELTREILRGLEQFRCADGGYNQQASQTKDQSVETGKTRQSSSQGSIYDGFLALLAYEESGLAMPQAEYFARWVKSLKCPDGSYTSGANLLAGTTPVTAAAVMLRRHLGYKISSVTRVWLLARQHPRGGFRAAASAPVPDLLSTATALQALSALHQPLGIGHPTCLEFVESLWDDAGGFHGHLVDPEVDGEYTYYGLLALGHLLA